MKTIILSLFCFFMIYEAVGQSTIDCVLPTAYTTLDINNVRAGIGQGSVLWWDQQQTPTYEVKGSGVHSLFAGGLWIGGLDDKDTLYLSNTTFNKDGIDFRPGPIGISKDDQVAFDRHWKINQSTIDSFRAGLFSDIPNVVLEWPAKGNPRLSFLPDQDLAPFEDVNGDGIYKAEDGDYPLILGDQSIWYVYSDGNCDNSASYIDQGQDPYTYFGHDRYLGIDVQAEAFAYASVPGLENITFYKLKIINRSSNNYHDVFMGNWVDVDLGFYSDDYLGTDLANKLTYCYNAGAVDPLFGEDIPMVGAQILQSPLQNSTMEQAPFYASRDYEGGFSAKSEPYKMTDFYHYLQGRWKEGIPMSERDGIRGEEDKPYIYPDPPNDLNGISECSENNVGRNRRFIQSVGPFDLEIGAEKEFFFAVLWTDEIEYPCPDITPLTDLAQTVQNYFDTEILPTSISTGNGDNIKTELVMEVKVLPNPAKEQIKVSIKSASPIETIELIGIDGRILQTISLNSNKELLIAKPAAYSGMSLLNFYTAERKLIGSEKVIWQK